MKTRPRLVVYCARVWKISCFLTTRKRPITSPPAVADVLQVEDLSADILYLRLHGIEGQPYLYGAGSRETSSWTTALTADQIHGRVDLFSNTDVFLEGCEGAQWAAAFFSAGARSVTGSDQPTWGRAWHIGPSSQIGREWLNQIHKNIKPNRALAHALKKTDPKYRRGWKTSVRPGG